MNFLKQPAASSSHGIETTLGLRAYVMLEAQQLDITHDDVQLRTQFWIELGQPAKAFAELGGGVNRLGRRSQDIQVVINLLQRPLAGGAFSGKPSAFRHERPIAGVIADSAEVCHCVTVVTHVSNPLVSALFITGGACRSATAR